MGKLQHFGRLCRGITALLVAASVATPATEALAAPCRRASGQIGYYLAKNYFGVAGCDGVEARPKELLELCRVFLGASSPDHVRYGTVLTGDFHSPENNTQCEFVPGTERKRLVQADHSQNAVVVDCFCKQCADGIDNDGDGARDFPQDSSCSAETDASELFPRPQCNDGIDNDRDGAIDLRDVSCANNRQRNNEASPRTKCQDGLDNDEDGRVDLADPDCRNNRQVDTEGPGRIQVTSQPGNWTVRVGRVELRGVLDTAHFSASAVVRGVPPGGLAPSALRVQWQQYIPGSTSCPQSWCDIAGGNSSQLSIPISPLELPGRGLPNVVRTYRAKFSYSGLASVTSNSATLTILPPNFPPPTRTQLACSRPFDAVLGADATAKFKSICSASPEAFELKYNWEFMNLARTGGRWEKMFAEDRTVKGPEFEVNGDTKRIPTDEFEVPLDLSLAPEIVAGLNTTTYYRALVSVGRRDGTPATEYLPIVTESARLLLPNQTGARISFAKNMEDQPTSLRPTFKAQASINVRPPANYRGDWVRFDWQVQDVSKGDNAWISVSAETAPWALPSSQNITSGADADPLWEGRLEIDTNLLPNTMSIQTLAETRAFRVIVRAPGTDASEEISREARLFIPAGPEAPLKLEVGMPNITTCGEPRAEGYRSGILVDVAARTNRSSSAAPLTFKLEYREGEDSPWAEVPSNLLDAWSVVSPEWGTAPGEVGTLWGANVRIKTDAMTLDDAERWFSYRYRVVARTSLGGVSPMPSAEQVVRVRSVDYCLFRIL